MEIIIVLLIVSLMFWLIFKILKGIISFLFGSSSNEETSSQTVEDIDSNSNKETFNHDVGAIDNEPSDLKYNNEVYISFKNIVMKAYESYKKSGYKIALCSDYEGFIILEEDSASIGSSIYTAEVRHDDQNLLELNDPFYIVVSYGILFDIRYYDDYKEKAEYLNEETKRPGIHYSVDTIGFTMGAYYCHVVVTNNKVLCEETEKLGEAEFFRELMGEARESYRDGEGVYNAKIRNENSSHDVGVIDSNSDKENYSHIVEATDEEPSDLKYKNEVYISFINKVQKAYESFKKSGYNIEWDSNIDGFTIFERGPLPVDSSIYTVEVHYDDQNRFKLNDPFYIVVKSGIVFERSDYDDYKKKAEYLNNRETKRPAIFYIVGIIEDSNFGVYYTNSMAFNIKKLCEDMEELGEAELFKQLFIGTRQAYLEGEEIYDAKIRNPEKY